MINMFFFIRRFLYTDWVIFRRIDYGGGGFSAGGWGVRGLGVTEVVFVGGWLAVMVMVVVTARD